MEFWFQKVTNFLVISFQTTSNKVEGDLYNPIWIASIHKSPQWH